MPIPVVCGQCGARFNAPDSAAGKRGKCPKCSAPITVGPVDSDGGRMPPPKVPAAREPAKPAPPPAVRSNVVARALPPQAPPPKPPPTVQVQVAMPVVAAPVFPSATQSRQTKACPFCGEEILATALKCKHCGEILDPAMRHAEEARRLATLAISQPAPAYVPPAVNVRVEQNVVNNVERDGRQGISFVAAFLSFLIPGLGQVYRGRAFSGLCWFVFTAIGYAAFIIPGLVLHLACVVSAFFG